MIPKASKHILQFFRWRANNIMNFIELIQFILSWKEWLKSQHLEEDAADCPIIHFVVVIAIREQTLWRAVPNGANIFGEWRLSKLLAWPKVSDFHCVSINENILRLDVPVQYSMSMHMINSLKDLINHKLHSALRQRRGLSSYCFIHIHFHQLKNQSKASTWFVIDHFQECDNIGMRLQPFQHLNFTIIIDCFEVLESTLHSFDCNLFTVFHA